MKISIIEFIFSIIYFLYAVVIAFTEFRLSHASQVLTCLTVSMLFFIVGRRIYKNHK